MLNPTHHSALRIGGTDSGTIWDGNGLGERDRQIGRSWEVSTMTSLVPKDDICQEC
jgi:hypothetical protein